MQKCAHTQRVSLMNYSECIPLGIFAHTQNTYNLSPIHTHTHTNTSNTLSAAVRCARSWISVRISMIVRLHRRLPATPSLASQPSSSLMGEAKTMDIINGMARQTASHHRRTSPTAAAAAAHRVVVIVCIVMCIAAQSIGTGKHNNTHICEAQRHVFRPKKNANTHTYHG